VGREGKDKKYQECDSKSLKRKGVHQLFRVNVLLARLFISTSLDLCVCSCSWENVTAFSSLSSSSLLVITWDSYRNDDDYETTTGCQWLERYIHEKIGSWLESRILSCKLDYDSSVSTWLCKLLIWFPWSFHLIILIILIILDPSIVGRFVDSTSIC